MPSIHLITSANLYENVEVPQILEALVSELCSHDGIESESVKAYHSLHNTWCMGEGAPSGFAHCEVRLLQGQPLSFRQRIVKGMHDVLCAMLRDSLAEGEVGVTVELREMESDGYFK